MISYKIVRLDLIGMLMQIRYSTPGKTDYYGRVAVVEPITEEALHELARKNVAQAEAFWSREESASEFQLQETDGQMPFPIHEQAPEYNPNTHKLEQNIYTNEDGALVMGWNLVEMAPEEKALVIRLRRNAMLTATDVEVVADRTPSPEMLAYRQALRDITQQETFPHSVEFPVRPID